MQNNLSLFDLMASIIIIFILVIFTLEKNQSNSEFTYKELENIIDFEMNKLSKDIGADYNKTSKIITVQHSIIGDNNQIKNFYKHGQTSLNNDNRKFLKDFFPKFFNILYKYKKLINSITIKGHASTKITVFITNKKRLKEKKELIYANSENIKEKKDIYLKKLQTSKDRAYGVGQYCINTINQNHNEVDWLVQKLRIEGVSFSESINLDENSSRRVNFAYTLKNKNDWNQVYNDFLNNNKYYTLNKIKQIEKDINIISQEMGYETFWRLLTE